MKYIDYFIPADDSFSIMVSANRLMTYGASSRFGMTKLCISIVMGAVLDGPKNPESFYADGIGNLGIRRPGSLPIKNAIIHMKPGLRALC